MDAIRNARKQAETLLRTLERALQQRVDEIDAQEESEDVSYMDFGQALDNIKNGECVARAGWNGKNMGVWMECGCLPPYLKPPNGMDRSLFLIEENAKQAVMPYLILRAADGSDVIGWLASQTDMLASDWMVIDYPKNAGNDRSY